LSDGEFVDLLDGIAAGERRQHVAACPDCQARADEARDGLHRALGAEMPEPSPLYWEAFRRQVGQRIEADGRASWRPRLAAALMAAAVLVGIVTLLPRSAGRPGPAAIRDRGAAVLLPPWSALPDPQDDAGLSVLQAMATGEDLSLGSECSMAECLAGLSEEDTIALVDELKTSLGNGRS